MTTHRTILSSFITLFALTAFAAPALADSSYVQAGNLSPASAVYPGNQVTFIASASGFSDPTYSISDSFSASGSTVGTIDKVGFFTWTPVIYDAGRHTITVTVTDILKHTASTTISIFVANNSIIIKDLSPGSTVSVGATTTLSVLAPGFTSPSYSVFDSTPLTTLSSANINSSGVFSWIPTSDDVGTHSVTLRAYDMYGHDATKTQTISVIRAVVATTTTATSSPVGMPTTGNPVTSPLFMGTTTPAMAPTPSSLTATSSANPLSMLSGTVPPSPQGSSYRFTTALAIGSRGTAVNELQKRLIALGYLTGTPTNYFGTATATAVKKFQSAKGLSPVGTVGPATRAALNSGQ